MFFVFLAHRRRLLDPITFPADRDDLRVMQEPVEYGNYFQQRRKKRYAVRVGSVNKFPKHETGAKDTATSSSCPLISKPIYIISHNRVTLWPKFRLGMRQSANDGKALPVESLVKHRSLHARRSSATAHWEGASPVSSMKTMARPRMWALF